MSSEETQKKPEAEETKVPSDEPALFEWTSHPLKRRPWVSAAVTVFVILVTVVVYYSMESQAFAALALAALLLSLAKFYFPTKYAFTENTIVIKTTTQKIIKKWSQFRSFYADKNGVLLSPFTRPSRMENFRGVYLMFESNGDRVVDFIKTKVEIIDDDEDLNEAES